MNEFTRLRLIAMSAGARTHDDTKKPRPSRPGLSLSGGWRRGLRLALHHQLLDLADGLGRVEALGADLGAVHDGVAAIQLERIFQIVQALAGGLVAAVGDPSIGLRARDTCPNSTSRTGRPWSMTRTECTRRDRPALRALRDSASTRAGASGCPFSGRAGSTEAGRRNWSGRGSSP